MSIQNTRRRNGSIRRLVNTMTTIVEIRELRKLQRRVRTIFGCIEDLRMDLALCGLPGLCSMARDAKDALARLDTALEERVHGI
jgi:hypothetical protein